MASAARAPMTRGMRRTFTGGCGALSGGALLVGSRRLDVTWASRGQVRGLEHSHAEQEVLNQGGVGLVQADWEDKAFGVRTLTAGSAGVRFGPAAPMCGDDIHQPVDPIRWADSALSRAMHHERFLEFHLNQDFPITFPGKRGNGCGARSCRSVRACSGQYSDVRHSKRHANEE